MNTILELFSNKKICVVGNSPKEIGLGKGKLIDSYDIVVRFNDFSTEYPNDYGIKTNVWVRASNDNVLETLEQKNNCKFDLIIVRSYHKNNEKSLNFYMNQQYNYLVLDVSYEDELSKKIKAIPSTGLLFLYIMKKLKLKVDVFGFDFFNDKNNVKYKTQHYYNYKKNKISKGIKLSKHKWKNELIFYKRDIE